MRAGRYEEALRYFDAGEKLRDAAKKYGDAVTTARQSSGQGTRAKAWFDAATIARVNGMEMLGFELAPDYAIHDGRVRVAFRSSRPNWWRRRRRVLGAATADERQRVEASKPAIDSRFHYRLTAVDHALASADALRTSRRRSRRSSAAPPPGSSIASRSAPPRSTRAT